MKKRNGFTLIEILMVVAILGILAAVVIPQFANESEKAKMSTLLSDLQTIRAQIQFYKMQHNGTFAGLTTSAGFIAGMTGYTKADGTAVTGSGAGVYGPYLQKIPANPFDNISTVAVNTDGPDATAGWFFNYETGVFIANDSDDHTSL